MIIQIKYAQLNCGDYAIKIIHEEDHDIRILRTTNKDGLDDLKAKYPNIVFEECTKMEL